MREEVKKILIGHIKNSGYSLSKLSEITGIHQSTMSRFISGKQELSTDYMIDIANKINLKFDIVASVSE